MKPIPDIKKCKTGVLLGPHLPKMSVCPPKMFKNRKNTTLVFLNMKLFKSLEFHYIRKGSGKRLAKPGPADQLRTHAFEIHCKKATHWIHRENPVGKVLEEVPYVVADIIYRVIEPVRGIVLHKLRKCSTWDRKLKNPLSLTIMAVLSKHIHGWASKWHCHHIGFGHNNVMWCVFTVQQGILTLLLFIRLSNRNDGFVIFHPKAWPQ